MLFGRSGEVARTCSYRSHPDLRGHTFDTTFGQTAEGKSYKKLRPRAFNWITWNKKLSIDKKSLVDRVSAHLYSLDNNSTDHTDNKLTDNLTTQIISERQRTKPCVALEVPNDKGESHLFQTVEYKFV